MTSNILFHSNKSSAVMWENATYSFVAYKFFVANCLVWFELRHGTSRRRAIAETFTSAPIVVPTLVLNLELALVVAARALSRTADLVRPQRAGDMVSRRIRLLRPAARFLAVFLPPTVALLALLDDPIATQSHLGFSEAAFHSSGLGT